MRLLATLVAALALLAGCGDDAKEDEAPERPTDGALVVFTMGGGIAAQPLRLEVSPTGDANLTKTIANKPQTRSFTLTSDDLATVSDALEEARGVDGPGISPGCADCFEYSVTADGVDFELDSVGLTDDATPVEQVALVAILEELAAKGA